MWRRLRQEFPHALAAVLMPDHVHLITPGQGVDLTRRRLCAIASAFARHRGEGRLWSPIERPVRLKRGSKLARSVRYVLLNPCREWHGPSGPERLVADPLCWEWSTHRDVVGAVAHPWVSMPRLRQSLGWRIGSSMRAFHKYVSSDESVSLTGTPLPLRESLPGGGLISWPSVQLAAELATRSPLGSVRGRGFARQAFVLLAKAHGARPSTTGWVCGASTRTVRRLAAVPEPRLLTAAQAYLGDCRLLHGMPISDNLRVVAA